MGMTQGLLATMVANTAPVDLRGTAYGCFNLACGLSLLIASVVAGVLWDQFGAAATFYAGALVCGVVIAGIALFPLNRK
jgi:MFS family permease